MSNTYSELPNGANIHFPGTTIAPVACSVLGMQGKRLTFTSDQKVALSTVVSIEYNDAMFLGEILGSAKNPEGTWNHDIKVEQVLTGLQSLMNLRSSLLGEGMPTQSPARMCSVVSR